MGLGAPLSLLLLAADPTGGHPPQPVSVWVAEKPLAQCSATDIRQELSRLPGLTLAQEAEAATLRVTLTDCFEGPKAFLPSPITAWVERVIQVQVTEGGATKALTVSD